MFSHFKKNKTCSSSGITIVEMLVVLAVLAVVFSISIGAFTSLAKKETLNKDFNLVKSVVDQARSQTIASKNGLNYGVHFETNKVILFSGDIFAPNSPTNEIYNLSNSVSISSILLFGGGSEIIFRKFSGKTEQNGSISVSLLNDPSKVRTISITKTGLISSN